jgi:transitional endoplasmic reticulum ATPase
MVDQSQLRRPVEYFESDGWRLAVVDVGQMLDAAALSPVDIMNETGLPRPVQRVVMSLAVDDGSVRVDATIHYGPGRPGPYFTAVGNGPLGTLLRRRVEAGDERAVRVVGGLQRAVDQLNRVVPLDTAAMAGGAADEPVVRTQTLVSDRTGAAVALTEHASAGSRAGGTRTIRLRMSVAARMLTAMQLAGLFDIVAEQVGRVAGPLSGRFTVSAERAPDGGRVTLDQVGGLDEIVAIFRDVAVSFRHPAAMARWGAQRPQGLLLYGPPGTGKTMLARALADEIGGTLREIRTPEILDKWLGGSERNLKRIFAEARHYRSPTVLLFDEFDSIIGYAGAGDDSGSHAINAVAGLFKQEMNNLVDQNPNVIVVATTNFPAAIDASLVRSGRFDIKLEVPRPDARGRSEILARMIRGLIAGYETPRFRMFADDIDLDELGALSEGMVGADLREVLRRTQMAKAMQQARSGAAGPIQHADLRAAIADLRARAPAGA